jgi:hypothetical protein
VSQASLARQSNRVVRRWPERDGLLPAFVQMYPQAEHYIRFTHRVLPLIALEPERG